MEKIYLEIINKVEHAKRHEYIPPAKRQKIMAKELADLNREFNHWKDQRLTSGKIIWHEGFYLYAKKYTLDDLFNYWFDNIYKK
jgi:D-alanine-D-alanine ligase-like ATP-grasp enzyme